MTMYNLLSTNHKFLVISVDKWVQAYLRDTMGSVLDYQNETSIAMESNLFASEGPCLQFVKKYICEVQWSKVQ